ncbi:MAG: hypothetical protein COV66_11040 [Nitrospinae bacterium CG11_big_fil_rev_8_21_14_0_20_45_15]|nr:MAG: hypothetical protein COV66_11040 [Nitrospinae bacterium CG11_big_fil_rev_8_21_14_0_20_45_15]
MRNLKILVADDDGEDQDIIKRFIDEGFGEGVCVVDMASTYDSVLDFLGKGTSYDVALFDLNFGAENGIEMLKDIRAKEYTFPVILLTGSSSQETVVKAFKGGASDYLDKSRLDGEVLVKAIQYVVELDKEKRLKNKAEKQLHRTGKLLEGAAKANHILLTCSNFWESLESALAVLGKAAQVEAVCIFCHGAKGEEGTLKEILWWGRRGRGSPVKSNLLFSYKEFGIDEDALSKAYETKFVRYRDIVLPQKLKEWCSVDKLSELLMFPIMTDGKKLGFLGIGSETKCLDWSFDELAVMEMTAGSIGGKMKLHSDEISFRSIVEGTSSGIGDEFFSSLVYNLASSLPVFSANFVEVMGYQNDQCKVVAGWEGDHFVTPHSFPVRQTPCEEIVAGMLTYYPDNVVTTFPKAKELIRLGIRGFAGVPCFDTAMKIIGCLWIADRFPLVEKERTLAILKMFASRAGAELERKRSEEVIKNMAYHDALTGLPNRMLLNDRLKMGLAHAQRNKRIMAILFIDLDGFKEINDNYGHGIGDLILQGVADRLTQCIREEDTLSRLGGDEFIVFLPRISSVADAENLAEKLLTVVRTPFYFDSQMMTVSLSIGISFFPKDGKSASTLLKKADEALYLAKNKGKNTYCLVD